MLDCCKLPEKTSIVAIFAFLLWRSRPWQHDDEIVLLLEIYKNMCHPGVVKKMRIVALRRVSFLSTFCCQFPNQYGIVDLIFCSRYFKFPRLCRGPIVSIQVKWIAFIFFTPGRTGGFWNSFFFFKFVFFPLANSSWGKLCRSNGDWCFFDWFFRYFVRSPFW